MPRVVPTGRWLGEVLNRLDGSIFGAYINFGVKTIPNVQHRLGYFPCFIHRMVSQLGSFGPSVFLNVVEGDGSFGVHTESPSTGWTPPNLEHFPGSVSRELAERDKFAYSLECWN
jgi:hypothetical protein